MSEHKDLPDSERHEPKGISAAPANTVYVSAGTGTGTWQNLLATVYNRNFVPLFGEIPDVSTAGSIFIPNPIAGVISKIFVTLQTGITAANAIVTAEINGVLVTGSSATITQAGSTGGSTFSSTPSGANVVSAGGAIEIITDGGSTTTAPAIVCILMDVS